MVTKKQSTFKLLIISLITLVILLLAGFFFFLKSKEKENQIIRNNFQNKQESNLSTKKQEYYPTKTIKIQKTSSEKYFVNWLFFKNKSDNSGFFEEGKNCFSAEEMPKILTEYQECWENNDWSGWEKELKDNYLLVKKRKQGENGQFHYQTNYKLHPISEADREEKEAEQRKKECKQRAEEAKERAKKWKEEHKNEWRICQKCGKKFCLETEGSIKQSSSSENGGKPFEKTEYFCSECGEK